MTVIASDIFTIISDFPFHQIKFHTSNSSLTYVGININCIFQNPSRNVFLLIADEITSFCRLEWCDEKKKIHISGVFSIKYIKRVVDCLSVRGGYCRVPNGKKGESKMRERRQTIKRWGQTTEPREENSIISSPSKWYVWRMEKELLAKIALRHGVWATRLIELCIRISCATRWFTIHPLSYVRYMVPFLRSFLTHGIKPNAMNPNC